MDSLNEENAEEIVVKIHENYEHFCSWPIFPLAISAIWLLVSALSIHLWCNLKAQSFSDFFKLILAILALGMIR